MTVEDARYYAKTLGPTQREIIAGSNGTKPTLIATIGEKIGDPAGTYREAEHLAAMNLLRIEQSRLGGKFHHNYVILNERGLQVQSIISSKKLTK